jgi:hypothetical protein
LVYTGFDLFPTLKKLIEKQKLNEKNEMLEVLENTLKNGIHSLLNPTPLCDVLLFLINSS